MAELMQFDRCYAAFREDIRPFERADDVGFVVSLFLASHGSPRYPIGDLIGARLCSVWLGAGNPPEHDEDNLDLIFEIGGSESVRSYEIVLRSSGGTVYGGCLTGIAPKVTDEIIHGHRVLTTELRGRTVRYEFSGLTYLPVGTIPADSNDSESAAIIRIARGTRSPVPS